MSQRRTAFVVVLAFCSSVYSSFAQAPSDNTLQQAEWFYQHENYEEALSLLRELKAKNPESAQIAYYLGLTLKRLQDYQAAKPYLEAAVMMSEDIKSALPELIDLLYQLNRLQEAKTWIAMAKEEKIAPARVCFLNGLVLMKEGKGVDQAIAEFEEAGRLDPSLDESSRYQVGLAQMKLNNLSAAETIFQAFVVTTPRSGLAQFANEYLQAIDRSQAMDRAFRGKVGYALLYDDNVVLAPHNERLAEGISNQADFKHALTAQAEYNFKSQSELGLKVGASFYGTKHNDMGAYDLASFDVPVQPMISFPKAVFSFPLHYNYVSIDGEKYLQLMGLGNLNSFDMGNNQMAQFQLQYNTKDYCWPPDTHDDQRSGREYLVSAGWFRFFGSQNNGYWNLRYAINYEDTDGQNWRYVGNRFTFSSAFPLQRRLTWSFVTDYMRMDFTNENSTYHKDRHDNVFTVSNLLAWEFMSNTELELSHAFIYDGSSIGVYKYDKNLYGVGVTYRF
jgi:tetratricopeptide (TPR) repeat protein